jgi:hypothetical protein
MCTTLRRIHSPATQRTKVQASIKCAIIQEPIKLPGRRTNTPARTGTGTILIYRTSSLVNGRCTRQKPISANAVGRQLIEGGLAFLSEPLSRSHGPLRGGHRTSANQSTPMITPALHLEISAFLCSRRQHYCRPLTLTLRRGRPPTARMRRPLIARGTFWPAGGRRPNPHDCGDNKIPLCAATKLVR